MAQMIWSLYFEVIEIVSEVGMVEDMPEVIINSKISESCELGKLHRHPFPKSLVRRPTHKLELIPSDICELMSTPSLNNSFYFALFIDNFSRIT